MHLVRDVLDKQVLDRRGTKMGRVDGLVVTIDGQKQPEVAFIEQGMVALGRRLGPRCGRMMRGLIDGAEGAPFRIPWIKIKDIGFDVEVDFEFRESPFNKWQERLRRLIFRRVPGI